MRLKRKVAGVAALAVVASGLIILPTQSAMAGSASVVGTVVSDVNFAAGNSAYLSPEQGSVVTNTAGPSNVDTISYDAGAANRDAVFQATGGKTSYFRTSPTAIKLPSAATADWRLYIPDSEALVVDRQPFEVSARVNLGNSINNADSTNIVQRGVFGGSDNGGQIKMQMKTGDDYPQCRFAQYDKVAGTETATNALIVSASTSLDIIDNAFHTISCWYDGTNVGITVDGTDYNPTAWNWVNNDMTFGTPVGGTAPWRLGSKVDDVTLSASDACLSCEYDWFKLEIDGPAADESWVPTYGPQTQAENRFSFYGMDPNGAGEIPDGQSNQPDIVNSGNWSKPSAGYTKYGNGGVGYAWGKIDMGTGYSIDRPMDPEFFNEGWRIQADFKVNDFAAGSSNDRVIIQKGNSIGSYDGSPTGYWRLMIEAKTGLPFCLIVDKDGVQAKVTGRFPITDGQYHTVSCTWGLDLSTTGSGKMFDERITLSVDGRETYIYSPSWFFTSYPRTVGVDVRVSNKAANNDDNQGLLTFNSIRADRVGTA